MARSAGAPGWYGIERKGGGTERITSKEGRGYFSRPSIVTGLFEPPASASARRKAADRAEAASALRQEPLRLGIERIYTVPY